MRRKRIITVIAIAILAAICTVTLGACNKGTPATSIDLPKLSMGVQPDNSIPIMTASRDYEFAGNIDRGFRLETYYTLGSGEEWPYSGVDGYEALNKELDYYASDKASEIQVYIYLCYYNEKPLDDKAFEQMKKYFEYIRSKRMSMVLRFSYEFDQENLKGPTQKMLLKHLEQLKGFMHDNVDLINDTVTAYQFGCIGAWGEWGATGHKYNEKKVLNALLDMMPDGTYYQGRYMRVVNQTAKNAKFDKVGYHNDFLIGRPHPWNTAADIYTAKDYTTFFNNAPYRINDGEMPWGGHTEEPNEIVDGKNFIKQCMEHRLATLSIKHNYKEIRNNKQDTYNIERWKKDYITAADLEAMNCPYYAQWFTDGNGNPVQRSVFEYLRDFLGYHLMLSNLNITKANGKTTVSVMVTNYGMGTPLTLDKAVLRVMDNGVAKDYAMSGFNLEKLTSYGQTTIAVTIDGDIDRAQLGISLQRNCSTGFYGVRTANNVPYIDGFNMIR